MSPGNLYRYFPSKEAIVEGLCEVDQAGAPDPSAPSPSSWPATATSPRRSAAGMREHVLAKPPEKARLIVEIWAEAGRNPRWPRSRSEIDADVLAGSSG